jgi:hypothetical protein
MLRLVAKEWMAAVAATAEAAIALGNTVTDLAAFMMVTG